MDLLPPRFRSWEDASLFMECMRTKTEFPEEKWIVPFVVVGNLSIQNPEYKNAPYEVKYVHDKNYARRMG